MLILDIHMSQLLDFEGELEALEAEIKTLSLSDNQDAKDIFKRRKILKKKRDSCVEKIYGDLNDWQTCQVARHSSRPQAIDYIGALFTDFIELSGDRLYAEDAAIIAGLAKFNDQRWLLSVSKKDATRLKKSTAILVWPDRKGIAKRYG